MDKFKDQFEPEITLSYSEQTALVAMSASEGYKVLHRIMRSQVDELIMSLINEPGDDDAMVLNKHKLAKAGALFFDGVVSRMNFEIGQLNATTAVDSKPIDITESMIDIGPAASTYEDIEHDAFDGFEEGLL